MEKIELDEVSVEISPCSRDFNGEIDIHVKVCVNGKVFQSHETISLNDMQSLFDTILDIAGEKIKRLILEGMK